MSAFTFIRPCWMAAFLVLVAGSVSALAQATREAPADAAPSVAQGLPPALKQSLEAMPQAGEFRFEDIVRYRVHRGRILAEFTFPPALERLVQSQAEQNAGVRVAITDSRCLWTIQRTLADNGGQIGRRGMPRAGTDLTCYDPAAKMPLLQSTILRVTGSNATFRAADLSANGGRARTHLLVSQNDTDVVLFWRLPPKNGFRQRVQSLVAMEAQYPQEWQTVFMPVARQLQLGHILHRHAAADVYRCFDQIQPDDKLASRVAELVEQFDSPDVTQRQAAQKAMLDTGRQGVLALLRMEREDFSPEQNSGVDAVISADAWRPMPDPAAARKNLNFLLDCLDDDDAAVRSAAKLAIAELIQVPLVFDVAQPPEMRLASIDALCEQARDVEHFAEFIRTRQR